METENKEELKLDEELRLWQMLGLQAWEMFDYIEDDSGTAQCDSQAELVKRS